jgi:hypothetical protein
MVVGELVAVFPENRIASAFPTKLRGPRRRLAVKKDSVWFSSFDRPESNSRPCVSIKIADFFASRICVRKYYRIEGVR